eukprot:10245107-Lingulodinium_polyedra.AAC.1
MMATRRMSFPPTRLASKATFKVGQRSSQVLPARWYRSKSDDVPRLADTFGAFLDHRLCCLR